jgi:hypothetical protein
MMKAVLGWRRSVDGGSAEPQRLSAVVLIAAVLLGVASTRVLDGPAHVSSFVVDNSTAWPASVSVRPAGSSGWLDVGTVAPVGSYEFRGVLDQGTRWEVRFRYAGRVETSITMDRSDLAAAGWKVQVPAEVERQARQAGLSPAPPARRAKG